MKTLVLLSLAFVAALAAPAAETSPLIVGGSNAAPGEFPFIVSLQRIFLGISSHLCGGAIISTTWAISAAHCITESSNLGRIELLVGKHNLGVTESTQVYHSIAQTVLHPQWRPGPQVGPDDLVLVRHLIFKVVSDFNCLTTTASRDSSIRFQRPCSCDSITSSPLHSNNSINISWMGSYKPQWKQWC